MERFQQCEKNDKRLNQKDCQKKRRSGNGSGLKQIRFLRTRTAQEACKAASSLCKDLLVHLDKLACARMCVVVRVLHLPIWAA
eukprot:533841-Pelagomonas_calceolata.AAC.1